MLLHFCLGHTPHTIKLLLLQILKSRMKPSIVFGMTSVTGYLLSLGQSQYLSLNEVT
jgi:hypothetical protein